MEKERELQRLNAELDEKQRKLASASAAAANLATGCSPNPRKKLSANSRGKGPRPRCGSLGSSRPASRSTESDKEAGGDGEKFVWAPIKGPVEGGSNNFIWALATFKLSWRIVLVSLLRFDTSKSEEECNFLKREAKKQKNF